MEEELRHATEMMRHAEEKREKWNQRVNTLAALLRSHGTALLEYTKTPATNLQFTYATFPTTEAPATSETSPPPPSEWFDSGITSEVESSDGTSAESVEDNPMKDSSDEYDDNVPATHESVNGNTMEDLSNNNILETKGELAANKDVPATHGEQNECNFHFSHHQSAYKSKRFRPARRWNGRSTILLRHKDTESYAKLQKRNEVDTPYATSVIVEENQETVLG
ncbi:hypothetical protein PsorP6_002583 [Peronosclerospora sorghi]|uniref:Uncharacterized protein n=1 Tax=Peronosclerospora sorghi TaxID=230839 RepID=A0ACC0WPA1_9STRA|nr:hypothetical protein PsorP6_002583 [Peronosclerospora sorghi]